MLSSTTEAEIVRLAERYGQPRRVAAELTGAPFDPIAKTDRYGEVCMVVRRPGGKLLTAIKTFYPAGAFRLLTGGVSHGERIADALWREVAEETGLEVEVRRFLAVIEYHQRESGVGSLRSSRPTLASQRLSEKPPDHQDTKTARLKSDGRSLDIEQISFQSSRLGALVATSQTASQPFATFAFLLDEVGGTLSVSDPDERIGAFREVAVDELPALAATLERAPDEFDEEIGGSWRDWGEFRAVVHRTVFEALAG